MPAQVNGKELAAELKSWGKRRPRIMRTAAAALALVLAWGVYLSPLASIRKISLECNRLQRELIQGRHWIEPYRRGELPHLPPAGSVSAVMEHLNQLARQHQVQFLEISPGVLRAGDPKELQILPVELYLQGEYKPLGEFIGELDRTPALGGVTVRRFSIDREERLLPRLRARLSIELFLSGITDGS